MTVGLNIRETQIRATVRYGRKCTFYPVDSTEVTGYVGAMDSDSYLVLEVLEDKVSQRLIHGSCPRIDLHIDMTLDAEPERIRKKLLEIIGPFRRRIAKENQPR